MAHTIERDDARSDDGDLGTVDECPAREHGGRPSTWRARRYGHAAVTIHAAISSGVARVREPAKASGVASLPIEDALAHVQPAEGSARLRAALADAEEDRLEEAMVRPEKILAALRSERLGSLHDAQAVVLWRVLCDPAFGERRLVCYGRMAKGRSRLYRLGTSTPPKGS